MSCGSESPRASPTWAVSSFQEACLGVLQNRHTDGGLAVPRDAASDRRLPSTTVATAWRAARSPGVWVAPFVCLPSSGRPFAPAVLSLGLALQNGSAGSGAWRGKAICALGPGYRHVPLNHPRRRECSQAPQRCAPQAPVASAPLGQPLFYAINCASRKEVCLHSFWKLKGGQSHNTSDKPKKKAQTKRSALDGSASPPPRHWARGCLRARRRSQEPPPGGGVPQSGCHPPKGPPCPALSDCHDRKGS